MEKATTAAATTAAGYPENRAERIDRRRFTWRTIVYGFVYSRRKGHRRVDDGEAQYTDFPEPYLVVLAVAVMILSSLDAFLTLILLDRGATEINPIMAVLIGEGTLAFASSKMLLTGFSVLLLVFLARAHIFNRVRVGLMLAAAFIGYAVLVFYEIILLSGSSTGVG